MSSTEELATALAALVRGTTLLKAGRTGKPHFRFFRLSPDLTKLSWDSSKKKDDAEVLISEVTEICLGQKTKVFQNNLMPEHEDLSFSLLYGKERTLDIICKVKSEFTLWTFALQRLIDKDMGSLDVSAFADDVEDDDNIVEDLRADLYTWGAGTRGMLGNGADDDEPLPKVVEALLGHYVKQVAVGLGHTMALTVSGDVYSWGSGASGRLGLGGERDRFTPLRIGALKGITITQVACGWFHSAAVSEEGEVYTWGRGTDGRLGYDAVKQYLPTKVEALADKRVTSVACGEAFTLCLPDSGEIFAFGNGDKGETGCGERVQSVVQPRKVAALDNVAIISISVGQNHCAAISSTGQLYLWGHGLGGKLGLGDEKDRLAPTLLQGVMKTNEIVDVSCGSTHTVVLTSTGMLYTFGEGSNGQLGLSSGLVAVQSLPATIKMPVYAQRPTKVAAGNGYSVVVTEDGQLFCWGMLNDKTTLITSNPSSKSIYLPRMVEGLHDRGKKCKQVACGVSHAAALVTQRWVPDEEAIQCMACRAKFTAIRRRHHCRNCRGVFCGSCSSKKIRILTAGYVEPERVCDKCFNILNASNN